MELDVWRMLCESLEAERRATGEAHAQAILGEQLALLYWDFGADPARSLAVLDALPNHSRFARELVVGLRLQLGQATAAAELLEAAAEEARVQGGLDAPARELWLEEAACIHLLWAADPIRAARACRSCAVDEELPPPLGDLLFQVLLCAGEWEAAVSLRRAALADPAHDAVVASVLCDELGRPQEALDLLASRGCGDGSRLYALEVMLDAAVASGDLGRFRELVDVKYREVSSGSAGTVDAAALSAVLSRIAEPEVTPRTGLWSAGIGGAGLPDDDATNPLELPERGWRRVDALQIQRNLGVRRRSRRQCIDAYLGLMECSEVSALRDAYRLRAAQLMAYDRAAAGQVVALLLGSLRQVSTDPVLALVLERGLILAHATQPLQQLYERALARDDGARRQHLRKAAIVAEAWCDDPPLAAGYRRDLSALVPPTTVYGALQRLYRRASSRSRLTDIYGRQLEEARSVDPGTAAILETLIAAQLFAAGQVGDTKRALQGISARRPDDALASLLLSEVARSDGDREVLVAILREQAVRLSAPRNRGHALVALAQWEADPRQAYQCLEQAAELCPHDVAVLVALSDSCERRGDLDRALIIADRLAELTAGQNSQQQVDARVRLARVLLLGAHDSEGAERELLRALDLLPDALPALRALARVYRLRGDVDAYLETLRRLEDLAVEGATRANPGASARPAEGEDAGAGADLPPHAVTFDELIVEYSAAARQLDRRADVLDDLERLCRRARRIDHLAELLLELCRHSPEESLLSRLARVLGDLGDAHGALAARRAFVTLARTAEERCARQCETGSFAELAGELAAAAECFGQAFVAMPHEPVALAGLRRILPALGRFAELSSVLSRAAEVIADPAARAGIFRELAELREREERIPEAIDLYERALALAPDAEEILARLEGLYAERSPRDLARILAQRAQGSTDAATRSDRYLSAARILGGPQDAPAAIKLLRQALDADPSRGEAFVLLEQRLCESGDNDELLAFYKRALIQLEAGGAGAYSAIDLHVRRGQLLLVQRGRAAEAGEEFLSALRYDPKSELLMKLVEQAYLQAADWLGLIGAYERRAQLLPDNELFRQNALREAARIATGRLPPGSDEALRLWRAVLQIDPVDEEALENVERLAAQHPDANELADVLGSRALLALSDEERVELLRRLAVLCERNLEDLGRAAAAYEGILAVRPHHLETLAALARLYESQADWTRCDAVLQELIMFESDPGERAMLCFRRGSIAERRLGREDEAMACYRSALVEQPTCLPAIHGLRELCERRGQWREVLLTLEAESRAWERGPAQAGVLARMAEVTNERLGDRAAAGKLCHEALDVDPECRLAQLKLFEFALADNNVKEARALCATLGPKMQTCPDAALRKVFFRRASELASHAGDVRTTLASLAHALAADPRDADLLVALLRTGRRSNARVDLSAMLAALHDKFDGLRRDSDQAQSLLFMGALAEYQGELEQALGHYLSAVTCAPHSVPHRVLAADLLALLQRPAEAAQLYHEGLIHAASDEIRGLLAVELARLLDEDMREPAAALSVCREYESVGQDALGLRRARLCHELGATEEAVQIWQRLVGPRQGTLGSEERGEPSIAAAAACDLCVLYLERGAPELARKIIAEAGNRAPLSGRVVALKTDVRYGPSDGEGVAKSLARGLRKLAQLGARAEDVRHVRGALVSVLRASGRERDAAKIVRLLVEADGERLEDRIELGELLSSDPASLGEAESILERVASSELSPAVLTALHRAWTNAGNRPRAERAHAVRALVASAPSARASARAHVLDRAAGAAVSALGSGARRLLGAAPQDRYVERLFNAARDVLEPLLGPRTDFSAVEPISRAGVARISTMVRHCTRLVGIAPQVFVGSAIPGGAFVDGNAGGRVIIDRAFEERPHAEGCFVLCRVLELARSKMGCLSRLDGRGRARLAELMDALMHDDRPGTQRLRLRVEHDASARGVRQIAGIREEYAEYRAAGGLAESPRRWVAQTLASADQVALLGADCVIAATRIIMEFDMLETRLGATDPLATAFVQPEVVALLRFYLSAEFDRAWHHVYG